MREQRSTDKKEAGRSLFALDTDNSRERKMSEVEVSDGSFQFTFVLDKDMNYLIVRCHVTTTTCHPSHK